MEAPNTTQFCANGHQPLDYADFTYRCRNVRNWPDWPEHNGGEHMHVGECRECESTISYPPPAYLIADLPGLGFEPSASTLNPASRCKLERIQAKARCKRAEAKLEQLRYDKVALEQVAWSPSISDEQEKLAEEERYLDVTCTALREIIALPDAELLEFLESIGNEQRRPIVEQARQLGVAV